MATPMKRLNVELLLSLSATFLSLAALVVSIFQTKIARDQQQASVWPYLQIGSWHVDDIFKLTVANNGVGPAIIKKVSYTYKGVLYSNHIALFRSVNEKSVPDSLRGKGSLLFEGFSSGDVIKAGDNVELYSVERNETKAELFSEVMQDSSFHVRVVFGDVYGNCWQVDRNKVEPLANCP